ncbi:SpoIIE family protein phosphatase [Streptomyces lonegramiae]|uniref:SpoIIE family protein phosphatase n=1 Tax=Streptomyces lonegramiae TaxID=3075524 RepID=A0ABU2XT34_9ACTN|nr:SpoIIE family protein phosphatase [Streptomyces sp. DSM 41529]MDT0548612.1 SpoIIE family protein phosphatase [Streptomyces sp. DSM 41529]
MSDASGRPAAADAARPPEDESGGSGDGGGSGDSGRRGSTARSFGLSRVPSARSLSDRQRSAEPQPLPPPGGPEPASAPTGRTRESHESGPDSGRESQGRAARTAPTARPTGPVRPNRPTQPARSARSVRRAVLRLTRTVASQVFFLQVAVVLLLAVAAGAALVLQSRHDTDQEARRRSLAVAESFANAPGMVEALRSPDPTAILQPRTERARHRAGVDFIVVLTTDGIRYTHPEREQIGLHFLGSYRAAAEGGTVTETSTGVLGPSVRAVVPVTDSRGKIVGLVAAGITVEKVSGAVDKQLPILLGGVAAALILATGGTALVSRRLRRQTHGLDPGEMTRMYEHHDAVLHSVREGVLIVDGDGRLLLANDEARRLFDLPPDAEGHPVTELGFDPSTAELLVSGRPATDEVHKAGERLLTVSHRPTDRNGGPPGSVATLRDTTELRTLSGKVDVARKRLRLLYDAGVRVGTTLDVVRTAQELTEYAVERFADYVAVDLVDPVLRGEEPTGAATGSGATARTSLRRTALSGIREDVGLYPLGGLIRYGPFTPQARGFASGETTVEAVLGDFSGWQEHDPDRAQRIVAGGIHSMIAVPLRARGVILGIATFMRSEKPEPFEMDDVSLAEELVTRAAVSIDNARRYTREHTMAVTLQRSLLPQVLPEQSALDVAYRYLPAESGVGGDWFDVIPLPGARVALVVGDVVGHGLHAAATMGRLRTAVHNFSTLDLPPDEILSHLDDLIDRIDQDERSESLAGGGVITGATCLYAIYDPVSRRCTMARAGHPPPAVVSPDGSVEFPEVPAGPPLGLGGLPFETVELQLPEGSHLVLYTDGLVEKRDRDIEEGLELLRASLSHAGRTPEETCTAVLGEMLPDTPSDDIALIVACTRVLEPERIADWEVPSDPALVSAVRAAVAARLAEWDLGDVAFTTELILSELITNAIRYATGPIRVRLLCDRSLICEVSDTSSTSPHLRYAATEDEGGRGLFLVSRFADRWGTRYTAEGKVIWTEQTLPQRGKRRY